MINPDPVDIPKPHQDLNEKIMTSCIIKENLEKLWNFPIDDTVSEENRITLYWHHRLQHEPLISLKRLTERGIIPKCITKIIKMPLCPTCVFSTTQRKQRNKI